ncbi:MAG: cytochrome P460 family protein [Desulfobacterales bacterium]|jgi:hypothetical protein
MMFNKKRHYFQVGLILIGILLAGVGSYSKDSDWLLKPPGLRPLKAPATVIPATHRYVNRKLELPPYRSASGTPLKGWSRKFIKTRRFSSDQSAWIFYRQSDLKQTKVIKNAGMPASLRMWPVGATLILEGYKGDAVRPGDAELVEIELMTKRAPASASASDPFFAVDWNYARFTPDGTWSLSPQKVIECHQCHSIAFQLTGDLVFTQFH